MSFCLHCSVSVFVCFYLWWTSSADCVCVEHDGHSESPPSEQRDSAAELQQEAEGRHQVCAGQLHGDHQNSQGTKFIHFMHIISCTICFCFPNIQSVISWHCFLSPDRGWDAGFQSHSGRAGPLWDARQSCQHCKYNLITYVTLNALNVMWLLCQIVPTVHMGFL